MICLVSGFVELLDGQVIKLARNGSHSSVELVSGGLGLIENLLQGVDLFVAGLRVVGGLSQSGNSRVRISVNSLERGHVLGSKAVFASQSDGRLCGLAGGTERGLGFNEFALYLLNARDHVTVIDIGVRAASNTRDNNGRSGNERHERLCVGLGEVGFLGGGVNGPVS